MPMKTPVHPGRIVQHDCLEPLGLSVTVGAKILGVTRQALNNVTNGKSGISPEMAIRLTKAFGRTEERLRMQLAYDLAARKNESKIKSAAGTSRKSGGPGENLHDPRDLAHFPQTPSSSRYGTGQFPDGRSRSLPAI